MATRYLEFNLKQVNPIDLFIPPSSEDKGQIVLILVDKHDPDSLNLIEIYVKPVFKEAERTVEVKCLQLTEFVVKEYFAELKTTTKKVSLIACCHPTFISKLSGILSFHNYSTTASKIFKFHISKFITFTRSC